MNIDDKRKAIEVLLACGDVGGFLVVAMAANRLGVGRRIESMAWREWSSMEKKPTYVNDWTRDAVARCYTDAAYRLIESSPTLQREWFGAR